MTFTGPLGTTVRAIRYSLLLDLRVHCRPLNYSLISIYQTTRSVSSTECQYKVNLDGHVLGRGRWDRPFQRPTILSCERHNDIACRQRTRSPSLTCTWYFVPYRTNELGRSETSAWKMQNKKYIRCKINNIV